eukprot:TRINITY_DN625_c0_g1_i1.p2 TRINITY_DN625_c0_g1~~TRINITY_DN625_c0_g1_i1.p2  ORF type:complete len:326 (+),score=46.21 TRINITY_DN625_c0_g1_i1:118-1095(+)
MQLNGSKHSMQHTICFNNLQNELIKNQYEAQIMNNMMSSQMSEVNPYEGGCGNKLKHLRSTDVDILNNVSTKEDDVPEIDYFSAMKTPRQHSLYIHEIETDVRPSKAINTGEEEKKEEDVKDGLEQIMAEHANKTETKRELRSGEENLNEILRKKEDLRREIALAVKKARKNGISISELLQVVLGCRDEGTSEINEKDELHLQGERILHEMEWHALEERERKRRYRMKAMTRRRANSEHEERAPSLEEEEMRKKPKKWDLRNFHSGQLSHDTLKRSAQRVYLFLNEPEISSYAKAYVIMVIFFILSDIICQALDSVENVGSTNLW